MPRGAFLPGANQVAVTCIQTTGGQAFDLGIIDLPLETTASATAAVEVDLRAETTPALSKTKFNVYNSPYFTMDRWFRDVHLLGELKCDSLRYDPTWGGHNVAIDLNSPQISGTPEELIYDFTDFDRLTDSLLERGIKPMYVMAYTPVPLQRKRGVWAERPADMDAWRRLRHDYAAHWRSTGRKVPYYEIWNEPDNQPFFFRGPMEDYFEIYRHGAIGVKEADPSALVGGPAIAAIKHDDSWLTPFLDFLSVHNYGNPIPIIAKARERLREFPEFSSVELMLTEYNSFEPLTPDFVQGGAVELHYGAARLLHDFRLLLNEQDVTRVYWAMFNDPDTMERCGLVSLDGHRKAAFNAFKIYSDMPDTRTLARSSSREIEAMAASDKERAGVAVWNISNRDYDTTIDIGGIPSVEPLAYYRIDREHGSYYDSFTSDTLEAVGSVEVESGRAMWRGIIPSGGVVYLRTGDPATFAAVPRLD
jgi:xylan 1,4-beta-xylosidase